MGNELFRVGDVVVRRVSRWALAKRAWQIANGGETRKERQRRIGGAVIGGAVVAGATGLATDGLIGFVAGMIGGVVGAYLVPVFSAMQEWKHAHDDLYLKQFQPIIDAKEVEIGTLQARVGKLEKDGKYTSDAWSYRIHNGAPLFEFSELNGNDAKAVRGALKQLSVPLSAAVESTVLYAKTLARVWSDESNQRPEHHLAAGLGPLIEKLERTYGDFTLALVNRTDPRQAFVATVLNYRRVDYRLTALGGLMLPASVSPLRPECLKSGIAFQESLTDAVQQSDSLEECAAWLNAMASIEYVHRQWSY